LNLIKLIKLSLITVVGAGLLQASILYIPTTGLGISAGPNSIVQNFSTPSITQQSVLATDGNTATQFAGLTLESDTSLYYDPNGAAGCGIGKGESDAPTMASLAACVGDSTARSGVGSNGATIQPSLSSLSITPDLNVDFNNPVSAASLFFAAPSAGPGSTSAYLVTTEAQSFNFIEISGLANSVAPVGRTTVYTFTALSGDVQASKVSPVPEPGTIGLLSLGLAGIGYFARRRKA
jgi:hypothetical protein